MNTTEGISSVLSGGFIGQEINWIVQQVLDGNWDNISQISLSSWHVSQLERLKSESGVRCLLNMWFFNQKELVEGSYCNATWDNHYCWPPTPVDTVITRPCSEAFQEIHPTFAEYLEGTAVRVCLENATWLWGNWTNYTECADSYEAYVANKAKETTLIVSLGQYMLFIGSILSMISLGTALSIFFFFRCLWCDRITIHVHLMAALMLRFVLLFIITEPFVFNRINNYRDVDILCKIILCAYLYATMSTVGWMFVQGVYLNGKLTTSVFNGGSSFKIYYLIGWVTPLCLLLIYVTTMTINHPNKHCWNGYSEMGEIWILIGPIMGALLLNLVFLINILRILMEKVHSAPSASAGSDLSQFRAAAKATLILFPVLGINNLLFLYVPGGDYEKYYVLLNTLFSSSQGVFVAVVYCFISHEVHDAIRRSYRRFKLRREGTLANSATSFETAANNATMMVEIPTDREPTQSTHRENVM